MELGFRGMTAFSIPQMMKSLCVKSLAAGIVLASVASTLYGQEWSVPCKSIVGVDDGDTLTCIPKNRDSIVVRFAGIDAPETGQAYWRVARDRLKELAVPGTVAECYKQDQYGRQVCRLQSPDGKDLADSLIGEGLAWHAVRFANEQTPEERA